MTTGIIVGAAPLSDERQQLIELLNNNHHYVIAADGGIKFFLDENIMPDKWIGDMDSSGNEIGRIVNDVFPDIITKSCSPIKDDTDMALAVEEMSSMNIRKILIFGGLGGKRIEHSLANIQMMHHYKMQGIDITMISDESRMMCLQNETAEFDRKQEGFVSVFSLTDEADVEIKGLYYEYNGILSNSHPLGVSNEFKCTNSYIKVNEGVVLIVLTKK